MSRFKRMLISLVVALTFTVVVCAVQPQPVYASSSTETILIVLGCVIGGGIIIALIMTLIVRNNPAWMPLGPGPETARLDRFARPPDHGGFKFLLNCGARSGSVPLLCW